MNETLSTTLNFEGEKLKKMKKKKQHFGFVLYLVFFLLILNFYKWN